MISRRQRPREQAQFLKLIEPGRTDEAMSVLEAHLQAPFADAFLLDTLYALCEKLAPRAEDYDAILSDDASGRLVSLLVKKVLDRVRQQKNLPPLKIWFVASGRDLSTPAKEVIRQFIHDHEKELQRVLIVTEQVHTGKSMEMLTEAFANLGLKPDIAAVSTRRDPKTYKQQFANEIIFGSNQYQAITLFGDFAHERAGVIKDRRNKTSAHPQRYNPLPKISQQAVVRAREDIDLIAEVFVQLLENKG